MDDKSDSSLVVSAQTDTPEPWKGCEYDAHRLLLLGESAYSWIDDSGELCHPSSRHAIDLVRTVIEDEHAPSYLRFMTMLTRALTTEESPSKGQREAAWARVAFTNYVPGTVGEGARKRPSYEMWERARGLFRPLLNRLQPMNVIVLGKEIWNQMPPDCDIHITDDVQGYRLATGDTAMCWAVDHPASGRQSWRRLAGIVQFVRNYSSAAKRSGA